MKTLGKSVALTVLILLWFVNIFAQAPDTAWTKTYGGLDGDGSNAVQQTIDGGYIITGWTYLLMTGQCDVYLVKTDVSGDTLWTRKYGGIGNEWAFSVQETFDSGYIIAGATGSFQNPGDVLLIKTDVDGNILWSKLYGGEYAEWAFSVQQTSDSGYIIVGCTCSYGQGGGDVWILKTDTKGDTLWTKTYGGIKDDDGRSVRETTGGGYVIVGNTGLDSISSGDIWLLKTDNYGDTIWTKTYGGINDDEGSSVQQTYDGGYIIAGATTSFGAGDWDVYLLRTDSLGDTLWTRTFDGPGADLGRSVIETNDGYVIAGSSSGDVLLLKTDFNGNLLWSRKWGGTDGDGAYSVQNTSDGGYIISGMTNSFGAGLSDVYLIKTGPDLGVEEETITNPKKEIPMFEVFPNPFTTAVKIECSGISEGEKVDLQIYDVSGRLVKSVPLTTRTLQLSTDLSPGVYFLKAEGFDVGKVIKLR